MRPHLRRGPIAQSAVIHRKAVVMLCHRYDIFGAGLLEQLCPGSGIEVRGLEHRNEVLVSELVLPTVRCNVVLVFFGTDAVHASGVPLTSEGWHRIDAPMDKDAELRVPVPFGSFISLERLPIRTKRSVLAGGINLFKQRGALAV